MANLLDWRARSAHFAAMAAYQPRTFGLTRGERDAVTVVQTGMVMPEFFATLGVPPAMIARHGAVSCEVAAAMAAGVRERSHVSIGLSVTGIAGPGGATPTKPVGLVYVALDAGEAGREAKEFRFHGDRSTIKTRSSQGALDLLRRWLLSKGQP